MGPNWLHFQATAPARDAGAALMSPLCPGRSSCVTRIWIAASSIPEKSRQARYEGTIRNLRTLIAETPVNQKVQPMLLLTPKSFLLASFDGLLSKLSQKEKSV